MKKDHDKYLRNRLNSKKLELEAHMVQHRINIAKFETKRDMLNSEIDSIEDQLRES